MLPSGICKMWYGLPIDLSLYLQFCDTIDNIDRTAFVSMSRAAAYTVDVSCVCYNKVNYEFIDFWHCSAADANEPR